MKTWYVVAAGGILGAVAGLVVFSNRHASMQTNAALATKPGQATVNTTQNGQNTTGSTSTNNTTSTNSTQTSSGNTVNSTQSASGTSNNSTNSTSGNSGTTQQVISTVQQMLQNGPQQSFDASGFVQYVYKQAGVSLPRTISQQAQATTQVGSKANLQPGDLVFFDLDNQQGNTVTFDGIYIGNHHFAALTTHGLKSISLNNSYWSGKFLYGGRVS